MRQRQYFAHTLPGRDTSEWQPLEQHLYEVATLAGEFAAPFDARAWGRLAGLWHDVGKFSDAFQEYLRANGDYHDDELRLGQDAPPRAGKTDHTSAGAQHAVSEIDVLGHVLAYPIAGHHAGLLDPVSDGACLEKRLSKPVEQWEHGLELLRQVQPPDLPEFLRLALSHRGAHPNTAAFSFAFFIRMLFSCLVDADFLDTEGFVDPDRAEQRPRWPDDVLQRMEVALDDHMARLPADDTTVNRRRRHVRRCCLTAAESTPGLFSLTVPTGGGKTLSSLAFALRHARLHELDRIIYVIPFTSIIEQNADVFRGVFERLAGEGFPDPVLEHHSAVDAGRETAQSRLAAQNWDAPLVVTTSVQFYESLFAHRTSRCRKLHNLSRAVVILDEVQKLPVDYLAPCLYALRELTANYGSSVVLCTATQPAVLRRDEFSIGLEGVREIVDDPRELYEALKRVDVRHCGRQPDDELVGRLQDHDQVLCIVNTRRHARELFRRIESPDGAVHLSAAMCAEHRSHVLDNVRRRLGAGRPCRVVSTQLVEAGVDLDFPVVYRAMAGLDSVAQAAGRCNRNGRLDRGLTYVFESEHGRREAFLRDTTNATAQIVGGGEHAPLYDDLLSLDAVERFFRLYYWQQSQRWDAHGLLDEMKLVANNRDLPFQIGFRTIGRRFRLIPDTGEQVIVPWREAGRELCDQLRATHGLPPASLLRRLQRFAVQVNRRTYEENVGRTVELLHDRYPVLISPELHYDDNIGLFLDREDFEAGSFMI